MRDTTPAWMTKGLGLNSDMFGGTSAAMPTVSSREPEIKIAGSTGSRYRPGTSRILDDLLAVGDVAAVGALDPVSSGASATGAEDGQRKEQLPLQEVECSGPPLERHRGVVRDTTPAWMKKLGGNMSGGTDDREPEVTVAPPSGDAAAGTGTADAEPALRCAPTLQEVDSSGPPLERHRGAVRDTKPAWMTKGLGVNTDMFGECSGELMKPGMTKTDLEEMEKRGNGGPDPFGEIFREITENTNATDGATTSWSSDWKRDDAHDVPRVSRRKGNDPHEGQSGPSARNWYGRPPVGSSPAWY